MSDVPRLYGRATSVNVQKPLWALHELGVAHERIDVGGRFGGLDSRAYRHLNPNGLIPTLVHRDVTLWESNAILRYVAATWGKGSLWPEQPGDRALADQWTDWAGSTFQPAWLGVFMHSFALKPEYRDSAALDRALEQSEALFGILDAALSRTPFLAGDTFTYADIACGAALHRWTGLPIARQPHEAVDAWRERLKERQPFNDVVATSFAELEATRMP